MVGVVVAVEAVVGVVVVVLYESGHAWHVWSERAPFQTLQQYSPLDVQR